MDELNASLGGPESWFHKKVPFQCSGAFACDATCGDPGAMCQSNVLPTECDGNGKEKEGKEGDAHMS